MQDLVEIARLIRATVLDFKGPLQLLIYLLVFAAFFRLLHIDIRRVPRALLGEFKDLAKWKFTVGSLNAAALVLAFVLGGVVIASAHLETVQRFIARFLGQEKAFELAEDSHTPVFFAFTLVVGVSIWCFYKVELERTKRLRGRRSRR